MHKIFPYFCFDMPLLIKNIKHFLKTTNLYVSIYYPGIYKSSSHKLKKKYWYKPQLSYLLHVCMYLHYMTNHFFEGHKILQIYTYKRPLCSSYFCFSFIQTLHLRCSLSASCPGVEKKTLKEL